MIATLGSILPTNDFPPALDLEFPGAGRSETGMSVVECLDWVARARGVLKVEYGVDPILYTSARVWRDDLGNDKSEQLVGCPLWLARYPFAAGPAVLDPARIAGQKTPAVPPPWGDADNWWAWQIQGDATGFPGFPTGNVDVNLFNPMRSGAAGARVKWVQHRLGYMPENVNGLFDDAMKHSVIDFQHLHGLVPDGIVGPRTFSYLAWQ